MKRTLLLLLFSYAAWGQTSINSKFSFVDSYGNKITIDSTCKLPKALDTTFLKLNLNGLHFGKELTEIRYDYHITDIKVKKKKKEFELRVLQIPKSKDVYEILGESGYSYYLMSLKKVKGIIQIGSVVYLESEI
jgi:hypothetical protein